MIVVPVGMPDTTPERELLGDDGIPLSESLTVDLTEMEKDVLRERARLAGVSMSAWARDALVERLLA